MENIIENLPGETSINGSPNDEMENISMNDEIASKNPVGSEDRKRRKKRLYPPIMPNLLYDVYNIAEDFPNKFKEKVCEECNWSVPTFYRKMRGLDKMNTRNRNKAIPSLSNAEKEMIISVFDEVYKDLYTQNDRFRANDKIKPI